MTRIVGEGYKYLLKQLGDFLEISKTIVISFKNDNTIFQNIVKQCTESTAIKPLFLIADAGPDSHKSNEVVIEKGIIPIIAARANSVGNILITEKGKYFRAQYIQRIYHRLMGKLFNLRTTVERNNSNDVVGYNRSKTPTRGI